MSDEHRRHDLTRRELLASALVLPVVGAWQPQRQSDQLPTLPDIWKTPWRVIGGPGADKLIVTRQRVTGQNVGTSRLSNPTDRPVSVKEVVLFEVSLRLVPPDTLLYGEGFQMLTQTAGSVGNPVDAGSYTDARHYRMPTAIEHGRFADLLRHDEDRQRARGSQCGHQCCAAVGARLHLVPALQRLLPLSRHVSARDRR